MSSEPMPEADSEREEFLGRTGWDVIYAGRRAILAFAVVAASAVAVYLAGLFFGIDALKRTAEEYWPVLASPIVGWFVGRKLVSDFYRPDGRVLVQLDPGSHMFRAVFVPERFFRLLTQTGNNVVYHTPAGMPVYTVKSMDLERGAVDYGWVHESEALTVMTRENAYSEWDDTLNEVLRENLELMVHPHVIGLGYARKNLREHLDMMGGALGLDGADYGGHTALPEEMTGTEGEDAIDFERD